MREKPVKIGDDREIIYSQDHWELLWELREKAKHVMDELNKFNIVSFLHGSCARGDVHPKSDIDVVLLSIIPSFKVELAISNLGLPYQKEIIQATPNHTIKGHMHLPDEITVTFPLSKYSKREYLFYQFGGLISLKQIEKRERVPGVNKKLLLIFPTEKGHIEFPVINQENRAAKLLNLEITIIQERVRVLSKRDEKGRTGIFLRVPLNEDETFEDKLKQLADRNPAVRHRFRVKR